jgi:hypothetical protein
MHVNIPFFSIQIYDLNLNQETYTSLLEKMLICLTTLSLPTVMEILGQFDLESAQKIVAEWSEYEGVDTKEENIYAQAKIDYTKKFKAPIDRVAIMDFVEAAVKKNSHCQIAFTVKWSDERSATIKPREAEVALRGFEKIPFELSDSIKSELRKITFSFGQG